MRRIAGRLAKLDNEKEFPEFHKIALAEYEKYGHDMAEHLPKYFEAVEDHHKDYKLFKKNVSAREEEDREMHLAEAQARAAEEARFHIKYSM